MKKRDNNRGFTLVELIIAIAILAIAISPLVANFIQSSKLNLKGRKSLNAMNLAQDVMEGISVYSATEFDQLMVNAGSSSIAGKVLPAGTTYDTSSSGRDASSLTTDAAGNTVLSDNRLYHIYNVQTADGNYNQYNIDVSVKASDTKLDRYNKNSVAEIAKIDQYYDVIYNLPDTDEATAIQLLKAKSTDPNKTDNDYLGHLERVLRVYIQNNGTKENPNYSVSVETEYSVTSSYAATLGVPSGTTVTTVSTGNISKAESNVLPRSVYLYFKGLSGTTSPHDNIEIRYVNTIDDTDPDAGDGSIDVYLLRTQSSAEMTTAVTYNTNYTANVDIYSYELDGVTKSNKVNVISNLRYNLSYSQENNYRVYKEQSATDKIDGVDDSVLNYYVSNRAVYTYNGEAVTEATYLKYISDGYKKSEKNIVYDVTVNIYDVNTGNKVGSYTGGLTD